MSFKSLALSVTIAAAFSSPTFAQSSSDTAEANTDVNQARMKGIQPEIDSLRPMAEPKMIDEADALFSKRGIAETAPSKGTTNNRAGLNRSRAVAPTDQTQNVSPSVNGKDNGWPLFRVDLGRSVTSEETPNQENKEQKITDRDLNALCEQEKCPQPSKTRLKNLERSAQTSQLMSE